MTGEQLGRFYIEKKTIYKLITLHQVYYIVYSVPQSAKLRVQSFAEDDDITFTQWLIVSIPLVATHCTYIRCVPLGSETHISQLVFPSRKSGCSQNSRVSYLEISLRLPTSI